MPSLDRPRGRVLGRALLAAALWMSAVWACGADGKAYTLAVVPSQPAMVLHKIWTPFVERLSRDIGAPVELKLYDTMPSFLAECESGKPDFVYISPNLFSLVHKKQKYVPLVRSSIKIRGQIFVRKDSPYQQIRDLKGKTIAFVGPTSVCSVLTQHALAQGQGPIGYNAEFSGSSINVAKSVLLGKVDAGAMLDASLLAELPDRNQIRVLLETKQIASHPLAAHPRVPPSTRAAVTRAVLALASSESGRALLGSVKLTAPVRADFSRDYAHFDDPATGRVRPTLPK